VLVQGQQAGFVAVGLIQLPPEMAQRLDSSIGPLAEVSRECTQYARPLTQ